MRKSKGTLDLARTQAARADVDTFDLTVNNSADTLDVRLPGTFRLQVGVADVVAGQLAFCTNSQTFAMCYTSFILRGMMTPKHNISILPQITGPCKYFCLTGSKPSTYLQQSKKCPIGTISLMPMGQDVLSSLSRADDLYCVFLGDGLVAGEGERVAAAALGQGAKLRRETVEL